MVVKEDVDVEVGQREVNVANGEMEITAVVKVRLPMPQQDRYLPNKIEATLEEAGQAIKRELYKSALEKADECLVEAHRQTTEFNRIGKKSYTIKAVFGQVNVDRTRTRNKEGKARILSQHAWETPRQIYITKGLKSAICDLVIKESVASTLMAIDKRAGSLLSSRSVLNILHREGLELMCAQEARARSVYEAIPEARSLIIERASRRQPVWTVWGWDDEEDEAMFGRIRFQWEGMDTTAQEGEDLDDPLEADTGQLIYYEQPQLTEAEGLIFIQMDEVRVVAQPISGRKELWIYTAVVNADGKKYYFSSESATGLFYQVGSLLAVLGVQSGMREVCVISDGARWIRNWYLNLPIARKEMVLCWYHLTAKCQQLLSSSFGPVLGWRIGEKILSNLWRGDVWGAIEEIACHKKEIINQADCRELINYLKRRHPYIANYEVRQRAQQWIANTRVEKLNDWAVSARCKGQGRTWTYPGVKAIAAMVVAERNGELDIWRSKGVLPRWEETGTM